MPKGEAESRTERLWNPREVYRDRVRGRKVVYLDHNLWIELREPASAAAASCRDACVRAVDEGRAVFPVSYAAVSEMLDLPDADLRKRHAVLMDQLSLGVTLRIPEQVHVLEARAAYRRFVHKSEAAVAREELFSFVPDYVGDSEIVFADEWTAANVSWFMEAARQEPRLRSLQWVAEHLADAQRQATHDALNKKYVTLMDQHLSETDTHFRIGRKVDKERLVIRERICCLSGYSTAFLSRSFVTPPARSLALRGRLRRAQPLTESERPARA